MKQFKTINEKYIQDIDDEDEDDITSSSDFVVPDASTTIIMLKKPDMIVCEISRMLMCVAARYVHTFAIIPTVSFPTTVMITLFIFISH